MHTVDAAETVGRIIEFFPGIKQQADPLDPRRRPARRRLSQRLLPRAGGGRVGAFEVMVNNARIADLIRDDKADEMHDAIEEGAFFHMQTFSQALIALVARGRDRPGDRRERRDQQHDFLVALEHALKHKDATRARGRRSGAAADEPELRLAHPAGSA